MKGPPKFNVIVLGVIFDPGTRKILLGRRENDPHIPELKWCFPGGRVEVDEDVHQTLKREIKLKTGYEVKNLGSIFSRVHPKHKEFFQVYFLCQVLKGEEKAEDDIVELKWVDPEDVEKFLNRTIHKRLKEYILNLQPRACKDETKKMSNL